MKRELKKTIKSKDVYKEFIEIINGKLRLSFRASQVLEYLMRIDAGWDTDVYGPKNIIDTRSRKILQKELLIERANLANQIKGLRNIGLIITDDNGNSFINELFMPVVTNNEFGIMFTFKVEQ